MNELIKSITQKTGISEDQAKQAVAQVLEFLKQKLPAPIAGQIDAVLAGGGLGNVAQGLGSLLGKK